MSPINNLELSPGRTSRNYARWLFVLPAMLVVLGLLVYPLCSTLFNSFTNRTLIKTGYAFRGLDNYTSLLADSAFHTAFVTTIKWTVYSLTGQILIGFTAALCLNQVRGRLSKTVYRICMIIPWAFPSIAIALVWKWMLNGIYGFIPTLLVDLGLSDSLVQFLSNPDLVLPTLAAVNIWFGFPMIMVNVLAALQTIPKDQYEAAQIDGARAWQSFRHITFPHIKVVVGLLVVLRTIWVFNSFDIIFMMTAGGPSGKSTTMSIFIYNLGWVKKLVGKASAGSVLLLIFLLVLCGLYFFLLNRWEKEDR